MKGEKVHIHQIRVGPSWMDPIVLFLKDDILPEKKGDFDKVRKKTPRFWLSEDQRLYKHSFSEPYLLCVHPEAIEPLLEELKVGCQLGTGYDEDAPLVPPWVVGRRPVTSSRIVISAEVWGGVRVGASLGILGGWYSTRCFFLARLVGGGRGVRSLP